MATPVTDRLFQTLVTKNPEELSFRVKVKGEELGPSGLVGKLLQAYSTFSFKNLKDIADGWGEYVYTTAENAEEKGYLWLYFAKPKTEAEKSVPFRTTPSFDDHEWDPILKAIGVIQDPTFPQSTYKMVNGEKVLISAPRNYVREVFVPEVRKGTLFQLDEFISPSKFNIPQYPVPIPSLVSYDINGKQGVFPSCLHDDLSIPSTRTTITSVAGDAVGVPTGVIKGQNFPATNFIDWQPHYISDNQEMVDGVWYRRRIRVTPPAEPETISK